MLVHRLARTAAIIPALIFCVGIAAGVPPQSAAEASPDTSVETAFPLRSFKIEGNTHFSDEDIIGASGLKIGDPVIPKQFEDALQKLSTTGAFNSLRFRYEPDGDGYGLIFEVEEITEFYPIRFEAFDVPNEELMTLLAEKVPFFGAQVPPTGPIVPSGLTVPVIDTWSGIVSPRISASKPHVVSAPALGPSISPSSV